MPEMVSGLMAESDARNLCIRLAGLITAKDYEEFVLRNLEKASAQGGFTLLFHYVDYKGWEKEAADMSFQAVQKYGQKVIRNAYVMPPASKMLHIKLVGDKLIKGEVRYFDDAELQKAVHWLKTGDG